MKKSPEKQEKSRASENSRETAKKDGTKNETVRSSSETSPNASSSGLQTTVGKRRRTVTGIKTAYSFFCDEVLGR